MNNIIILAASALVMGLALVGPSNVEVGVKDKEQSNLAIGSGLLKREVIIRDSIYDSLPAEAQKTLSLPKKAGPQQLPNVDLTTPIIITKMPYREGMKP